MIWLWFGAGWIVASIITALAVGWLIGRYPPPETDIYGRVQRDPETLMRRELDKR